VPPLRDLPQLPMETAGAATSTGLINDAYISPVIPLSSTTSDDQPRPLPKPVRLSPLDIGISPPLPSGSSSVRSSCSTDSPEAACAVPSPTPRMPAATATDDPSLRMPTLNAERAQRTSCSSNADSEENIQFTSPLSSSRSSTSGSPLHLIILRCLNIARPIRSLYNPHFPG
jgi:hypothetical protein